MLDDKERRGNSPFQEVVGSLESTCKPVSQHILMLRMVVSQRFQDGRGKVTSEFDDSNSEIPSYISAYTCLLTRRRRVVFKRVCGLQKFDIWLD
jgi:hypothetical protein